MCLPFFYCIVQYTKTCVCSLAIMENITDHLRNMTVGHFRNECPSVGPKPLHVQSFEVRKYAKPVKYTAHDIARTSKYNSICLKFGPRLMYRQLLQSAVKLDGKRQF